MMAVTEVSPREHLDVTVALILHDDPPNIARTIDSILSQDYSLGELTILCLDDGTSPCARLVLNHREIWTVDLPPKSSISVAKNAALRFSRHEFIFLLDDHIYLEPGGLNAAMAAFQEAPQLAGICGFYRSKNDADWNILRDIKRHSIYGKSVEFRLITLEQFTTFSTGIGIVRRSVFGNLMFPEDVFPPGFGGEDVPALLTVLNDGQQLAFVPQLAGLHEHNITFFELIRKLEIEVRGRFSVFYWASDKPEFSIPYLHGFLNFPILFYATLALGVLGLLHGQTWLTLIPGALLLVECVLSLRCMFTPVKYSLNLRILAAFYVLASDLLTPLCGLQYLISSYKRPFKRLGISRGLKMVRLFLRWEMTKYGIFGRGVLLLVTAGLDSMRRLYHSIGKNMRVP